VDERGQRVEPVDSEQHHAAIRGQSPAIESGSDRFAANGWKCERQQIKVGHGERA